jgi:Transposase and inactivated derivatives
VIQVEIRQVAINLLKQGWKQERVASFLQVSQASISNWKKAYEKQGEAGLQPIPQSGRPASLNASEKEQLKQHLKAGAEACGFRGNFWTQKRVSRLIKEQFSVTLKPRQCGNILKELNYVLKLPQLKSYEQDAQKVEEWKTETIPEIKKKQKNVMP